MIRVYEVSNNHQKDIFLEINPSKNNEYFVIDYESFQKIVMGTSYKYYYWLLISLNDQILD